ncbi:amidohydrolase family protein [Bernardetia sp.]|uniref:amidohydrolase family protein n=1 Tax=Bernardetia sp. TaxID=1937974 RepID=UPI0025BED5BE|nr:amidohydrolase family protein [Bernardetia sp.]
MQNSKNQLFIVFVAFFLSIFSCQKVFAQQTFYTNGITDKRNTVYAFTNATIYTDYKTKISEATLVIKDGKILEVGKNITVPKGAIVEDLKGKVIYPSFIDLYSDYGMPAIEKSKGGAWWQLQLTPQTSYAFGNNEAVKAHHKASEMFDPTNKVTQKEAEGLRKLGFGTLLSQQQDGIVRGTSALVFLGEGAANEQLYKTDAAVGLSFNKGSSSQSYPTSLMGSMALLRQTYLDGKWYASGNAKDKNLTLASWNNIQNLPQIFEVDDKLNAVRADRLGDEFGKQYILKGSGDEYQAVDLIKNTGAAFILPLEFPKAFDVNDPLDAQFISFTALKHWEYAPANAGILEKADVDFAFTTDGLKDKSKFLEHLRKAVGAGLSKEKALKALTYTPAKLLGEENNLGTLKKGAIANFIITSGDLFLSKTKVYQNWIKGQKNEVTAYPNSSYAGIYDLTLEEDGKPKLYKLEVSGEEDNLNYKVIDGKDTLKAKGSYEKGIFALQFSPQNQTEATRLTGWYDSEGKYWSGSTRTSGGKWVTWNAKNSDSNMKINQNIGDAPKVDSTLQDFKPMFPFAPYAFQEQPKSETVLIKNATVWTNEADGILENTDVLLVNGKISKIGKNLSAPNGATTIDGTGKHLTSGIIDEHSHIAISGGVNEGVYANSSEVRIGDVINPEDVNIYRHLAGGVVAIQQLHGSANPIGGQSAVVKLRWGKTAEEMKIKGAPERIKFALGENVKHSNWSEYSRFPQSRMGVEQFMMDAFTRAKEYEAAKKANPMATRTDLQMEALLEIINGKRLISCHSYIASEILATMRVAEKFGFKVNVFTHILEGYKVAPEMAKHGVAGSTFSDWWAYKYEVKDAIPYNAALMNQAGVLTSINSDDAEMGRRLNQEAAKTVKYGGVSPEEAWKFVTLNPAKMLGIAERTGSIKVGKDADVVLWSDNPLSVYAKAEKTFVDGILYFDRENDEKLRRELAAERERIIQKMISAKEGGAPTMGIKFKKQHIWDCEETQFDYWKTVNGGEE